MVAKSEELPIGLTFDDVLLKPAASSVLPNQVELKTRLTKKLNLNIPLISAAMDTVTESQTAIAMAQQGGIGVIHRNLSVEEQVAEVEKVKRTEYFIVGNPITVNPNDSLKKVFALQSELGISSFPVLEGEKLVGILTRRDWLFEQNQSKKVKELMTRKVITGPINISVEKAKKIVQKHRIEKLPLVDRSGKLKGLITVKDIENKFLHPNACKDKKGRLLVAAAVGPSDDKRVEKLVEAEVDLIVIDTSHGHSQNVLDAVKRYKKEFKPELMAGNIATKEGAQAIISAGADAVKVGVGPGAICTTRVIAGVGIPQITAIQEACRAAGKKGIPVCADGGIKYSGDITKAIAAGASTVMIGSLLAGCEETPGKIIYLNNRKFKQYRGMGSVGAMANGSKERYFQSEVIERSKLIPQGIEGVVPYKGTIEEVIHQLLGGVRAGMGLCGAKNISQLKKAKLIKITEAGLKESHPHDVTITEEAPNYSLG